MGLVFGAIKALFGALIVFAAAIALWSAGAWRGASELKAEQEERYEAGARGACRKWISSRLHDPDSARWEASHFGDWRGWSAEWDGFGRVIVLPQFRVENADGALVVSMWRCEAQAVGESWRLVSLRRT